MHPTAIGLASWHTSHTIRTPKRPGTLNGRPTDMLKPLWLANNLGGRGRDRTRDTLIKSQLLYQLSYTPTNW